MMLSPSKGVKVTVGVDQIQLDPEDELTQNVDPENCAYYIYQNRQIVGALCPARVNNPTLDFVLTAAMINESGGQVSIIARDATEALRTGAAIPLDESLPQVGTISLNVEYFKNVSSSQYGDTYTQWITLFDDVDDDEFDGDLGEDDEELPMIKTTFKVNVIDEIQQASPPRMKAASPKREAPKIAPLPQPVVVAPTTIK